MRDQQILGILPCNPESATLYSRTAAESFHFPRGRALSMELLTSAHGIAAEFNVSGFLGLKAH